MLVMQGACVAFILAGVAGIVAGIKERRRLGRGGVVAVIGCSAVFVGVFAFLLNVLIRLQNSMANPYT